MTFIMCTIEEIRPSAPVTATVVDMMDRTVRGTGAVKTRNTVPGSEAASTTLSSAARTEGRNKSPKANLEILKHHTSSSRATIYFKKIHNPLQYTSSTDRTSFISPFLLRPYTVLVASLLQSMSTVAASCSSCSATSALRLVQVSINLVAYRLHQAMPHAPQIQHTSEHKSHVHCLPFLSSMARSIS